MDVQWVLQLHLGEQEYSQYAVQEQKEEQKTSDVGQLRDGSNEGVEQDSKILVLLDDLEDSTDSKRAYNSSQRADIQALNAVGN